jgi:hypothetical protein
MAELKLIKTYCNMPKLREDIFELAAELRGVQNFWFWRS